MRIAAIDFGTNSLRLLISDVSKQNGNVSIAPVVSCAVINQLGKNLHQDKNIEPNIKTIDTIKNYTSLIKQHQVTKTFALATSVFRDSKNAVQAKNRIEEKLKIPIDIISPKREAELMFKGICVNRKINPDKKYLSVDIGGGSCEFILSNGESIKKSFSLPIGCLRSKNQFLKTDPPTKNEIESLNEQVTTILPDIKEIDNIETFFAFGGTITSLAKIAIAKQKISIADTENYPLHKKDIETFLKLVSNIEDKEINNHIIANLDTDRQTVIRTGSMIVLKILACLSQSEVTVTNQGILYGITSEYAYNKLIT